MTTKLTTKVPSRGNRQFPSFVVNFIASLVDHTSIARFVID